MPVNSPDPDLHIPDRSFTELLLDRLPQYGNDVALIDSSLDGKSVTFEEMYNRIRSCAGFLHKSGLGKGDVVGLCAPTSIEFPVAMFGIIANGAVVTPCNPTFTKGEILRQFTITAPKMVFVHEDAVETMKKAIEELSFIQKIFVIGKSAEFTTIGTMTRSEHEKDFPHEITFNLSEDLALLPYSSGTTGEPKTVMLTHKNIIAMILGNMYECDRNVCYYTDVSMFHVGGIAITMLSLLVGWKLVVEKDFHVEKMLEDIAEHKVTRVFATPPMMIEMANAENFEKFDTSSLQEIQCVGASLSPPIMIELMRRYNVQIVPVYGMTEFAPIARNNDAEHFMTSVGQPRPNTKIKVVDLLTGEEVGVDAIGEILVSGPQMMKGYFNNPEETRKTIDNDDWLHTGDIGRYDEHGMLYIIDRLKEVIKYKAVQVSPAELESVILKHPKVEDVGVIGIPDPSAGELPKAFVVKKYDSLTQEEIIQLVKGELADYKQLRGGVEFIEKVPKTLMGKIQRGELKKMANV